MSIEANKQVVERFFDRCNAGELDEAFELMADTALWWVPGHPEEFPGAGTLTKAQYMELAVRVVDKMPGGLKTTIKGLTAEDDRVAVEVASYAETTSGKIYNNQYHFLFEVRDGLINGVREYMDTLHAMTVLWTAGGPAHKES